MRALHSTLSKCCLWAALLCLPLLVSAHRQHLSWTEVALSDDKRSAEITHRLHQHDSVALLRSMGFDNPDLDSLEHLAVLAVYAARNTQLILKDGTLAEAEIIGAEAEGDFVFVYQELLAAMEPLHKVRTSVFMDINLEQVNRVNVLHMGGINSLQFKSTDDSRKLLPEPSRD